MPLQISQFFAHPSRNLVFQFATIASPKDPDILLNIITELNQTSFFNDIVHTLPIDDAEIYQKALSNKCGPKANEFRNTLCKKEWVQESMLGIINHWQSEQSNNIPAALRSDGSIFGTVYHAFCIIKTTQGSYVALEYTATKINNEKFATPCIQVFVSKDLNLFLKLLATRYCYNNIFFVSKQNVDEKIECFYLGYESQDLENVKKNHTIRQFNGEILDKDTICESYKIPSHIGPDFSEKSYTSACLSAYRYTIYYATSIAMRMLAPIPMNCDDTPKPRASSIFNSHKMQ